MRAFASACLVSALSLAALGGCIDNDRVRVQSLSVGPNRTFTYSARTNTVMTENDDGAAEQIRRDWLAQALEVEGMCNGGYVVYRRRLQIPPQSVALAAPPGPLNPGGTTYFGNGGDVVYTGSCL
jgi:hypothetical protein